MYRVKTSRDEGAFLPTLAEASIWRSRQNHFGLVKRSLPSEPDGHHTGSRGMTPLRSRAARRATGAGLFATWMLALSLGFGVSLCPPGMDMGSDMAMGGMMNMRMDMAEGPGMTSIDPSRTPTPSGPQCPFAGDEDGGHGCPFALDGVGPCGTTASAPAGVVVGAIQAPSTLEALVRALTVYSDIPTAVQLPPPRA